MKRLAFAVFAAGAALSSASAALTVEERGEGFAVLRDGTVVVEDVRVDLGPNAGPDDAGRAAQRSFATLADGSRVWNRWNETRDRRFRLEVAERADGAVEISVLGQAEISSDIRLRKLELKVPERVLRDRPYESIADSTRFYRTASGTFGADFTEIRSRWLAAAGLTFDFNPLGAVDFYGDSDADAIQGVWSVVRKGGHFVLCGGGNLRHRYGDFGGAKIVIREGGFSDYEKHHLVSSFHYKNHLNPSRLLAFGAPKHGAAYADGDVVFTADRDFGWLPGAEERRTRTGHPEGVPYSAVSGEGRAAYRFGGLADGWYVFTVETGNYGGWENRFDVSVAGVEFGRGVSVAARKVRFLSRAVRVTGGAADIEFSGRWLVSALAVQPVMGDGEDFSMRRGFWLTEGYEPSVFYRTADFSATPRAPLSDTTDDLPVPGEECAAVPRQVPTPVELPDPNLPSLAWLQDARRRSLLYNMASLSELDDPDDLRRYLDQELSEGGYPAAMVSGMHSRHTYPTHLDRGREAIGRLAAELKRRGLKLIDHHDATLLWNVHSGLRVLMERLPELIRCKDDNLPSFQLCPNNPEFKRTYYAYLRSLVEAGVDGFLLDEVEFWAHGCTCRHCREGFRRDTGWSLPYNECDAAFADPDSALRRRWYDWRRKTITNWFVGLRRYVKDIRPDLVLCIYTTNGGFFGNHPKRGASSDLLDQRRVMNLFGTEIMARNVMRQVRAILPYRRMKNLLVAEGGAPVYGWYYNSDWQDEYVTWMLCQMTGQTLCGAAIPIPADAPQFRKWDASGVQMVRKGAVPIAHVALLFSAYSRDGNRTSDFTHDLFGAAQALEARHIPYVFLADDRIERGVPADVRVLFVGAAECLSDAEIGAIRSFAGRGGRVVVNGAAGSLDGFGMPRANDPFKGMRGEIVRLAAGQGAPFETREVERLWNPSSYRHDPEGENAYRTEIESLSEGATWWKCRAPDQVYTSLWREKSGDVVIHFCNATGVPLPECGQKIPLAAPDPAFPPLEEDIVFTVPLADVKAVTAASPDFAGVRPLEFRSHPSGRTTVRLPRECLSAYTLVRIQGK